MPCEIAAGQRETLVRFGSWPKFHDGPRRRTTPLLATLPRYPGAVLVAGCQRSGTTMLTRIIARATGFRGLALTSDDELDAALTLCGEIDLPPETRYCFQTTYLNSRYAEYATLRPDQRLIWVLRDPYSVVHSMVHNWKRFALNELYEDCGRALALTPRLRRAALPWPLGPSRIERACLSYAAKTAQIESICRLLGPSQLMVVDYDAMVQSPQRWLESIFRFVDEPYEASYARAVRKDSLGKAKAMTQTERAAVRRYAEPVYRRCLSLVFDPGRR